MTLTPKKILYSTLLNEGGGETYLVYFFSEKLIGGRSSYEKNNTILLSLWNIKIVYFL